MTKKQHAQRRDEINRHYNQLEKRAIHQQQSGEYMLVLQRERSEKLANLATYYEAHKT